MQFATALYNRVSARAAPEETAFDAVSFSPVRDVSAKLSASSDGTFTVAWKDERALPAARDGSAMANSGSGSVTVPGITDVIAILYQIVFADAHLSVDEMAASMASKAETGSAVQGEPVVLHLQRVDDRAAMRRVTVTTDSKGQLSQFTVCDGASASQLNFKNARDLALTLNDMCSGENSFVFVRPPMWFASFLPCPPPCMKGHTSNYAHHTPPHTYRTKRPA